MIQHSDEFGIRMTDLHRSKSLEFVGGRNFRLNHRAITKTIVAPLSLRMLDFLRIASSVYFTDRLVKRDRRHGPDGWPRSMALNIDVSDASFWRDPAVHHLVTTAVGFVSGDDWDLSFREADQRRLKMQQPLRFGDPGRAERVCLYSGGLDSAAGLAKQLSTAPEPSTLAVNVQHRNDIGKTVVEQLRPLSNHFKANVQPVIVPFEMDTPKRFAGQEETSQRSRSFLFVAVGGVVAWAIGASEVEVYESGIGAINAPLLAGMEGSQATRSAHPTFLKLMSRLLSAVSGFEIDVTLPFSNFDKRRNC